MAATVAGTHLSGDHASRPAGNTVPDGSLYSCTTHSLIYVSNYAGNSWSTWATLSATAGALVFLEAHTASSSAQLDFTSFISSTYDDYLIEGVDLAPATNAASMYLEIGTGGGPTYDTGNNYEWSSLGQSSDGVSRVDSGSTGLAKVFNGMSNNGGYGHGSFKMQATNLQSTAHRKVFQGTKQYVDSAPANIFAVFGISWSTTATAATALRFIMSSGNIASGTIRIYGVAKT